MTTIQEVRADWDAWKARHYEGPKILMCGSIGLKILLDNAGDELERCEDTHLYFRKVTQVVMFTDEDIAVMPDFDRRLFGSGGIVVY